LKNSAFMDNKATFLLQSVLDWDIYGAFEDLRALPLCTVLRIDNNAHYSCKKIIECNARGG